MTPPQSVFLLGAGYIGQPIIYLLLSAGHPVTTLVRNPSLATTLSKSGVKTILGTLDDTTQITEQVSQHSITINTASSDHIPSTEAVLAGVRKRVEEGLPVTLIHTSGTGLLVDDAKGAYKSEKIYSDEDATDVDSLPPTALHRDVDLLHVQAAREFGAKAKVVIMIPGVVYGFIPSNKRLSMSIPKLVQFALKHGFSGVVGEGKNVWTAIHIEDLARGYMALLSFLETASAEDVHNPYFFIEDGTDWVWREVAEQIGRDLFKLEKIPSPEVREIDPADFGDLFGPLTETVVGGNARCKATRLPKLGWVPKGKSVRASLEEDEIGYLIDIYS